MLSRELTSQAKNKGSLLSLLGNPFEILDDERPHEPDTLTPLNQVKLRNQTQRTEQDNTQELEEQKSHKVLCISCQNIFESTPKSLADESRVEGIFDRWDHQDKQSVEAAAVNGCFICKNILDCLHDAEASQDTGYELMYRIEDDHIRQKELVFYSVATLSRATFRKSHEIMAFTMYPTLDRCYDCEALPAGAIPEGFHDSKGGSYCSYGI
jgi:hypothetical protein